MIISWRIAAFVLASVGATIASAQAPATAPVVPTDWSAIPPLPWQIEPTITPDLTAYVTGEFRSGRCVAPERALVEVSVAVFVRGDGAIGPTVPQAIGCPTVEQFAAGLVSSFARNRLRMPAGGWYRTTISFAWAR